MSRAPSLAPAAEQWDQSQIQALGPDQLQSTRDDYLEVAKNILDKVAANACEELGTLTEVALTAETDAASEVWAALL